MSYEHLFQKHNWTLEQCEICFDGTRYMRYYRADIGYIEYTRRPGSTHGQCSYMGEVIKGKALKDLITTPEAQMETLTIH